MHKSTDQAVLTKAELRELLDARQDLVSRVAAGGAEVPTTSMHWKREATNLQWLVRQMSWPAPWVEAEPRAATEPRWDRALARLGKAKAKARAATGDAAPEEAVAGGAEAEGGEAGADRDGGEEERAEEAGGAAASQLANDDAELVRDFEALGAGERAGAAAAGAEEEEGAEGSAPWAAPEELWRRAPPGRPLPDAFGYGRIPAFWFTLNLPYNHLREIHRFRRAATQLAERREQPRPLEDADDAAVGSADPRSRQDLEARCQWVLDNPDLVATMHALRVELNVRYVMSDVVPADPQRPFQYWLRFEFGKGGNPHAHGLCYVPGNPESDLVVRDAAALERMLRERERQRLGPQDRDLRTWAEAQRQVAEFYDPYVSERHPCKDVAGAPLWPFTEPLYTGELRGEAFPALGRPQTADLLGLLEEVFAVDPAHPDREPDVEKVKYLLLALLESGQRHTGHGHRAPGPEEPCARRLPARAARRRADGGGDEVPEAGAGGAAAAPDRLQPDDAGEGEGAAAAAAAGAGGGGGAARAEETATEGARPMPPPPPEAGEEFYCRYLFPRPLRLPSDAAAGGPGAVVDDPYRPELRNLFLQRNDTLLNNFEAHLLLANLGNIDWRPLLNLWSVLEYLTKYTAKGGQASGHLGRVFEEVLQRVVDWEVEDGVRDLAPRDHEVLEPHPRRP